MIILEFMETWAPFFFTFLATPLLEVLIMNIVSVNWLELLGIWLFGGVMDLVITAAIFYIMNSLYYGRNFVNDYIKICSEDVHTILDENYGGWRSAVEMVKLIFLDLLFWPYQIPKLFNVFDKELQEISEQL